MNRTPTLATAFAVVILSVLAAAFLAALVTQATGAEPTDKLLVYISIFVGHGFMAVPLILYLQRQQIPLQQALRLYPVPLKTIIATVVIAIGAVIITDELDRLILLLMPEDQGSIDRIAELLTFDSLGPAIILFIGLGIFAPVGEELLFRGYLQQFLENHWQDATRAVLITAMTFAMVHLNPYWVIQAYVLGVLLGYLAWYSNSVLPAIILHGVYNSLALIINNLDKTETAFYLSGNHVSLFWLFAAFGLTGAGFYLLHNQVEVSS